MNKNYVKLFLTALITLPLLMYGIINNFFPEAGAGTTIICVLIWLIASIVTGGIAFESKVERDPAETGVTPVKEVSAPIRLLARWVVILSIIFLIPFRGFVTLYNGSVVAQNNYLQKTQERPGFYDAMYKTFSQKKELMDMNKETFVQIATLIMDMRKDGPALAWKWTQENTQIPFDQFTDFYRDLSTFIESKRQGYFELEKECQRLANANNILLETFPNNIYNKILGRSHIEYKYGFVSDSTVEIFNKGRENLK